MCGIFGHIICGRLDLSLSREALNTMQHRGPDQYGEFFDKHMYIGHRRLSLLDLSENGRQPMQAGHIVMAANGEVWNHNDLRASLEHDCEFRSGSDSEVILHGYRAWGIGTLLTKLEGMYGLCIYDQDAGKLYLVRDRYGIKPLYYALGEKGFALASEAKALLAWDESLRYFSQRGVYDWLRHRGSPSGLTIYHQVFRLMPGSYLTFNLASGTYEIKSYYDVLAQTGAQKSNPDDLPDLLQQSVTRRMHADVPLGVQLSGGVDSSLVSYELARARTPDVPLQSFSIGFSDAHEQHMSEEIYAIEAAERCGLTHHQININRHDVRENFKHVLWLADGMLDFPNTVPIYMLCRFAKERVTALLTGEGADELFGGYSKFPAMLGLVGGADVWRHVPDIFVTLAGRILHEQIGRMLYLRKNYTRRHEKMLHDLNAYISPLSLQKLFRKKQSEDTFAFLQDERFQALPFEKQLLISDHKTYLPAILERQDKASMGASVEARVPFMDQDLVQWAINLDVQHLFDQRQTKKILKSYATDVFNPSLAYRRKVGFPLPVRSWLEDEQGLGGFYAKVFDEDFVLRETLDMPYIRQYLADHSFDRCLLNYPDPERQWIRWFLMVLRQTQDVFGIRGARA